MLSSACTVQNRIRGTQPPFGTGPIGAPNGKRWISVTDVLVWNAKTYTTRDSLTWNTNGDKICDRNYNKNCIPLRDYQMEACTNSNHDSFFKSGSIEITCGAGKSRVGAELIRRTNAPAIILTGSISDVAQWVSLVKEFITNDVMTLSDAKQHWKISMTTPSIIVTTYHSIVGISKNVKEHKEHFESNNMDYSKEEVLENRLMMILMCERFGYLVMDEVHMAVADHFISAGFLRSSAVLGLSGSLIREDEKIERLISNVGPTLYSKIIDRSIVINVISVPMSGEHRSQMNSLQRRSKFEQTFRALNPYKIHALEQIFQIHNKCKIIVFCDIQQVAKTLHSNYTNSLLMTGCDNKEMRSTILEKFAADVNLLFCTRICDASINFPVGCVVVQYNVSSGSRQQEVQRCGRGTRDVSGAKMYMYHLVNVDTEEEEFVQRRISHIQKDGERIELKKTSLQEDIVLSSNQLELCKKIKVVVKQKCRDSRKIIQKRMKS